MVDFIKFSVGSLNFYIGILLLSPILVSYKLKLIPNYLAKEKTISHFFKGWDAARFKQVADQYSLNEIDKITRPKAIDKIKWHQQQDHKVVIVSASIECWLIKWCEKQNIELISTRLEIKGNKLTGKFSTKNCHGPEKARRVKELYDLKQYDHIYAYGDSKGDKELLELADSSFYNYFR